MPEGASAIHTVSVTRHDLAPVTRPLRFLLRSALLILHLAYGLLLALIVKLDAGNRLPRERMGSHWSALLMRLMGVRLRVSGMPMSGGGMIVANHVSWIDIPLIYACAPTRFVSKSEVRDWPVAGWLAEAAGTFYLRRGKGGARPLINRLIPHLRALGSIVIFPEGTTTDGSDVLPFHPRLFCAAIESACPVQPVALRYGCGSGGENIAPFVGDDDLVSHVIRMLRNRNLEADVVFGAPLDSRGRTREQLADAARDAIRSEVIRRSLD